MEEPEIVTVQLVPIVAIFFRTRIHEGTNIFIYLYGQLSICRRPTLFNFIFAIYLCAFVSLCLCVSYYYILVQYKKVRSCNRNPCCANKHQLFYEYRTWDVDVPSLLADLTRNKAEALLRTVPRGSSSPRFMEQTIPHP